MKTQEVADKVARLRAWMSDKGYGAVALGGQTHVAWLCAGLEDLIERNMEAGLVRALVTHDSAYLVTQNIEGPRLLAEEDAEALGLEVRTFPWYVDGWDDTMRELAPAGEKIASDGYAAGEPEQLALRNLRLALGKEERQRYRVLGQDATKAMESTLRQTVSGDTERTVAARFVGALEGLAIHPVVVLVGGDVRRRQFRHPSISDAPITESALCVLVGVRGGLNISLTRSITIGAAESVLEANHRRASEVAAAMVAATVPGNSYGDALQAGIDAYGKVGVPDEWREHYQGGGIAYHIREVSPAPLSDPNEETTVPVAAGHAVAWNPTVQGAKSEDTFLIGADGQEVITQSEDWPRLSVEAGAKSFELPAMLDVTA